MIEVRGGTPLSGTIKIQGSKNAVLPMMAAALLGSETTVFTNVPRIQDVFCMMGILQFTGCECRLEGSTLTIGTAGIRRAEIPREYMEAMRSSIMMLGALLGRMGEARTCYPGGCLIGSRPIDLHIMALKALGAEIREENGQICARAERLRGGTVAFPYPSVGATENALLAAAAAEGTTTILGAAREPEIGELCLMLNAMGADISGIGTGCLTVRGAERLSGVSRQVPGDRIVAGTYLAGVMACQGEIRLEGVDPGQLGSVLDRFQGAGLRAETGPDWIEAVMEGLPSGFSAETGPYPAFPTDLQSQTMAVMAAAEGSSVMAERVFEGRYRTAGELRKLGAGIEIDGRIARIQGRGKQRLLGARVKATDLRGGAALVIGGLAARGVTEIEGCGHIRRGYEDICRDLKGLGAKIREREEGRAV